MAAALVPELTLATLALQVAPATIQLTSCAGQSAGKGAAVTQLAAGEASGLAASAPLVHEKNAAPVVGAVLSVAVALVLEAALATAALQVLPATVQLVFCAGQSAGGGAAATQVALGDASGLAESLPLVQAKNAVPVVGAVASLAVAFAPETALGAVAVHVLPATLQLTSAATQSAGGASGVVQVAAGRASGVVASLPLVHKKNAAPVVGLVLSVALALAAEATLAAVALQVLPPTVQLTAASAHSAATGAAARVQVAAGAARGLAARVPLVQAKSAEPVVGIAASVAVALAPEAALATVAVQVLPATVQLTAAAGQSTGAGAALVQVALGDANGVAASLPLLHEKNAVPVLGTVVSVALAFAPEAVLAAMALQVLPATVQLTAASAQSAGGVGGAAAVAQVATGFDSAAVASLPLLQAKNAEPWLGSVKSVAVALAPEAVWAAVALQVALFTVQLTVVSGQSAAAIGADAALTHVAAGLARGVVASLPLEHKKNAEPVLGALPSVAAAIAPESVKPMVVALQLLLPTVQLTADGAHSGVLTVVGVGAGVGVTSVPEESMVVGSVVGVMEVDVPVGVVVAGGVCGPVPGTGLVVVDEPPPPPPHEINKLVANSRLAVAVKSDFLLLR